LFDWILKTMTSTMTAEAEVAVASFVSGVVLGSVMLEVGLGNTATGMRTIEVITVIVGSELVCCSMVLAASVRSGSVEGFLVRNVDSFLGRTTQVMLGRSMDGVLGRSAEVQVVLGRSMDALLGRSMESSFEVRTSGLSE
jgi:hypothetical protein